MKLRVLLISLGFMCLSTLAQAQWNTVPNHGLGVGRGPGFTSPNPVGPCLNTQILTWPSGVSGDPACNLPSTLPGIIEKLTANRIYFIRNDGNNTLCNGRTNAAAAAAPNCAFSTGQHAADVITVLNVPQGIQVEVQFVDDTFTTQIIQRPWLGAGTVVYSGNAVTPGNVILSTTSADTFTLIGPTSGTFLIRNLEVRAITSGNCVTATGYANLQWSGIRWGNCAQVQLSTLFNSISTQIGDDFLVGNSVGGLHANLNGKIYKSGFKSTPVAGTHAYSGFYAGAAEGGIIFDFLTDYTGPGTVTGPRYLVHHFGLIETFGGEAYFPGNSAGSQEVGNGGYYVGDSSTTMTVGAPAQAWASGSGSLAARFFGLNSTVTDGGNLQVITNDAFCINCGGMAVFGGNYSTTNSFNFAGFSGRKENATSGNTAGYGSIYTTPNGGNLVERIRISSVGGGMWPPAVTGGDQGVGTLNAAGLFVSGVAVTTNGITALTGDVTATGPGSVPATIGAAVITYAKMQNVAGLSVVGRAASSAGVAADITGTADQVLRVAAAGASMGFGALDLSKSAAVGSSILPLANGGCNSATGCIRLAKSQKFTANGTWTPATGILGAIIECFGAGGGGGGAVVSSAGNTSAGGGGGAGSKSKVWLSAAQIATAVATPPTVTIGTAGTGGTTAPGTGGNGTDTSVGALCVGKGGSGGSPGTLATGVGGGPGGIAGTGDVTGTGQPGFPNLYAGASLVYAPVGGGGGSSEYGGGAIMTPCGSSCAGGAGTGFASGGAGGASTNGSAAATGGAGTAGLVIISEFTNQ